MKKKTYTVRVISCSKYHLINTFGYNTLVLTYLTTEPLSIWWRATFTLDPSFNILVKSHKHWLK